MIDLHSHILPGVDDGAPDFKTSLEMLRIAAADGITTMVATPHIFIERSHLKSPEQIKLKYLQFKEEVKKSAVNINLLCGAEVFFASNLREQLQRYSRLLCLNNSDYFLLEFPPNMVFPGSKDFIFSIMADGFIPIICHPERNEVFQANPQLLYQFLELGALSQVNAGSFKGHFGPGASTAAYDLLKYNLVHIIASDAHNCDSRRPGLSFIYNDTGLEEEKVDMLTKRIPEAVLRNQGIPDIGPLQDPNKRKSVFLFFRSLFK